VARYDPQKDHRTLLRALTLLTQNLCAFSCLLVGADMSPGNEELARLIGEAGIKLHTHLLGPREDIPSIMNALDLHVLSSASEGFPNVLAEAMACGTPCVSTDVGDAALIVGTAGWLVPRRNPVLLAQAITTAINERAERPAEWVERQQACRNRIVDNFGLERMVSSYRALWQSALDSQQGKGN
jgi:glycosyltransferase involved in cell wall biosynthesis